MEYGVSEWMVNASPLENPSISLRDPQVWQGIFGGGQTDSGVSVTPSSALAYPPLWRAINLISGDVAKLPLQVYRRNADGGKDVDRRHPAWSLLNREVSPACDSLTFKETLTSHALLRGNGYAAIERNNRGDPIGLLVLEPDATFPGMADGMPWFVSYINDEPVRLPGRDVLHVKGLSATGLVGYDVVTLMANALGVGMAAQTFGAKFFGQGANMSGLLMVPGHFDEAKIRNTMSAWDQMATGLSKAHKVALLQDGVKFQQLTVDPDKAQFLETRQHELKVVAQITGIPGHKLGDPTSISYASIEAENQSYLDEALDRWLRKWEMECNRKLLSITQKANDTHFIEFNRKALLRMSANDRANFYAKLQEHGDLTVNEVLKLENMPTIGEKGDRRYRPGNLIEIGEEPDEVTQMEPPEPNQSNMLQALLSTSVTRSLKVEHDKVIKAARSEKNFVGWLDTFYTEWIASSSYTDEMKTAFIGHATDSKRQLLDVAGCSTQDGLLGAVTDCVATWEDRGTLLTEQLIGE